MGISFLGKGNSICKVPVGGMFVSYRKEVEAGLPESPQGRRLRGSRTQTLSGFSKEFWVYHLLGEFAGGFGEEEEDGY